MFFLPLSGFGDKAVYINIIDRFIHHQNIHLVLGKHGQSLDGSVCMQIHHFMLRQTVFEQQTILIANPHIKGYLALHIEFLRLQFTTTLYGQFDGKFAPHTNLTHEAERFPLVA